MPQKRKFSNEIELEICNKYINGLNTIELSNMYSFSRYLVTDILKRNNISLRSNSESKRKYTLDESYFDIINSFDKSYFLGFLYADGYNNNANNEVSIGLQESDKQILETFKAYLKSDRILYYKPQVIMKDKEGNVMYRKTDGKPMIGQPSWKLIISSQRIGNRLSELGCVSAKSLILEFPREDQVPEYLLPDFIRGYFDGDGCISINFSPNNHTNIAIHVNMVGTKEFLTGVQHYLFNRGIQSISVYKENKKSISNTWRLTIVNILDVLLFKKIIYGNYVKENENGDLYLQRKYDKFLKLEKYKNDNIKMIRHLYLIRVINRPKNVNKIIKLYLDYGYSLKKIADNFKVGHTFIYSILKNNNIKMRTPSKTKILKNLI